MTAIIYISEASKNIAEILWSELKESEIIRHKEITPDKLEKYDKLIFIGALGICVRSIIQLIKNKYIDPAVVCVDTTCRFAISVLSGHIGGGNELTEKVARILGAEPVITTQSDNSNLWALDLFEKKYGWKCDASKSEMNNAIFSFVNGKKTALYIDTPEKGADYLRKTLPAHVTLLDKWEPGIDKNYDLLIAVTPRLIHTSIPSLVFRPKTLVLGVGCRKNTSPEGVAEYITEAILTAGYSPKSIDEIATIELKSNEPLVENLVNYFDAKKAIYTHSELENVKVPNPSNKAYEVTGLWGVAESCALYGTGNTTLLIEKQKGCLNKGNDFTFALAMKPITKGHIEIIGAGPGDPELVSLRGKHFLEKADLILYAGSLVPEELTYYAKKGCVVRSSAPMNLEEQFSLMKKHYDRGELVVRLHTGDPCIYGAIQEQMAFFDKYGMSYHITPGISSFQAAAAALKSQFTIPEKVQSIILTRGEGRTPMPEKEQLHKLAKSQSTMCIYLSAAIAEDVQKELLMEYPPETPVAACYKLTWKEEKIFRGQLKDLAKIVRENNLTLTTLLIIGDAIDNRQGLSKLYNDNFKHLFRK